MDENSGSRIPFWIKLAKASCTSTNTGSQEDTKKQKEVADRLKKVLTEHQNRYDLILEVDILISDFNPK